LGAAFFVFALLIATTEYVRYSSSEM